MGPLHPYATFWRDGRNRLPIRATRVIPFAGRIGANQEFSVDEDNSEQRELLKKLPDAAPWIPIRDSLSLKQFLQLHIWKGAIIEAIRKHKLNCTSN